MDKKLEGLNFSDSKIKEVTFAGSKIERVDFSNCILTDVSFVHSLLDNVDFNGALLKDTHLWGAQVHPLGPVSAAMQDIIKPPTAGMEALRALDDRRKRDLLAACDVSASTLGNEHWVLVSRLLREAFGEQ